MSDAVWDVAVIGAGPAGMMAAQRAAELGRRTLLIEKNRKPGVKILMSGGTRCNLTHAMSAGRMVQVFGTQGKFLRRAFQEFSPDAVVRYFHQAGVPTKVEPNGKVFPASDRALDVQQTLWRDLQSAGVHALLGTAVGGLTYENGVWNVSTVAGNALLTRALIVTTGGCSYPGCGTTGDAYDWLRQLGHTIVAPRPALVPLTSPEAWIRDLSGVTLEDVSLRAVRSDVDLSCVDVDERLARIRKTSLIERRTALLFTHFGLSGPAAMDVSREVTRCSRPADVTLIGDLLPDRTVAELDDSLQREQRSQGARSAIRGLSEWVPQRLASAILSQLHLDPQQRLAELSRAARRELLRSLKSLPLRVDGSRGFAKAEVTAGGVLLDEIDAKTMASRLAPQLYVAGELLDVDGPIGGFNFQAAFSTGRLAAAAAAQSIG